LNSTTKTKSFDEFVLEKKIVGFSEDPFTLASGKKSHFYVNWRECSEDLASFYELLFLIVPLVKKEFPEADCFYGVPEGGTKLGLFLQYEIFAKAAFEKKETVPFAMGRAKPKERGPIGSRFFLGMPKGKTVIVEDVATTGESLLKALEVLKDCPECLPVGVVVLTDRGGKTSEGRFLKDVLKEKNIKYIALTKGKDLLSQMKIPEDIFKKIQGEFENE